METFASVPPRTRLIVFAVDCAGRMYGEYMASVNAAMRDALYTLRDYAYGQDNTRFYIAVMAVGNHDYRWLTPEPVPLEDFGYEDLTAYGLSVWDNALADLDSKLSRHRWLNRPMMLQPFLFFIAKGTANSFDEGRSLVQLLQNRYYQRCIKGAVAVDEDAQERLTHMVGSPEAVFVAQDPMDMLQTLQECLQWAIDQSQIDPARG